MTKEDIYNIIKKKKGRITKIRKAIIDTLYDFGCMVSLPEINKKLRKNNINPNRSTIYREIIFLIKSGVVLKNNHLNKDYFEIIKDHHHHLICIHCNSFEKIITDRDIRKEEEKIIEKNKFKIINHSFDFYGTCHKCQEKKI